MGGCCQSPRFKGKVTVAETAEIEGKRPDSQEEKPAVKGKPRAVAREKRETKRHHRRTNTGTTAEDLDTSIHRREKRTKTQVEVKKPKEKKGAPEREGISGITIKTLTRPISKKYKKLTDLHSDRAMTVYLAESVLSKRQLIVKMMRKALPTGNQKEAGAAAVAQFRSEVVTISNLDHPNILKIFKLYEDKSHFYIVSEPVDGGNLIDYIASTKTLSEVFAAKVAHQVLRVLNYCHKHGVLHRSLQPSCILLLTVAKGEDPVVKVTGFGNAHLLTDQEKLTISVSSAYYMAPETLDRNYSEKSDVWSLGIILYQLLCGNPPFMGEFSQDVMENILNKRLQFPDCQWSSVNREAISLVTSMLSKNSAVRASIEDCLRHPWIQRYKDELVATAPPVVHALANLQRFKANQALKQAVLRFMSEEVENSEETKALVQTFKAMDRNGDGVLSRDELISVYEKSMSHDRANYTVDQVMKTVDSDNSGAIDFSEFMLASLNSKAILSKPNIQLLFRLFDEDGSGKVSVAEIKEKVRTKDNSVSDELWDELVVQVDSNGDGELDFDEFSQLLKLAVS